MNEFNGTYKFSAGNAQWIGTTLLFQAGDVFEITENSATLATISVKPGAGHLTGFSGSLRFEPGSKRALGTIKAPKPNGGMPLIDYFFALEMSTSAAGRKRFRMVIMKDPTPSDDVGGEYDGEQDP